MQDAALLPRPAAVIPSVPSRREAIETSAMAGVLDGVYNVSNLFSVSSPSASYYLASSAVAFQADDGVRALYVGRCLLLEPGGM